jgi:hypothetical protein
MLIFQCGCRAASARRRGAICRQQSVVITFGRAPTIKESRRRPISHPKVWSHWQPDCGTVLTHKRQGRPCLCECPSHTPGTCQPRKVHLHTARTPFYMASIGSTVRESAMALDRGKCPVAPKETKKEGKATKWLSPLRLHHSEDASSAMAPCGLHLHRSIRASCSCRAGITNDHRASIRCVSVFGAQLGL